jgi:hypothetical protein
MLKKSGILEQGLQKRSSMGRKWSKTGSNIEQKESEPKIISPEQTHAV